MSRSDRRTTDWPGRPQPPLQPPTGPAAFDGLASTYDASFTNQPIGRWLRSRVWRVIDDVLPEESLILDLGCGTGEDAVHLAARGHAVVGIDESPMMVRTARTKWSAESSGGRAGHGQVDFAVMRLEHLGLMRRDDRSGSPESGPPRFDGAVANFGVLNCVDDLPSLARELARVIREGGHLIAVVMAPFCIWETAWFVRQGDLKRATRRWLRPRTTARLGRKRISVAYPSPARLGSAFEPFFETKRVAPLGIALPPSYAFQAVQAHRRVSAGLEAVESALARFRWLATFADHYCVVLERRSGD